MVRAMNTAGIDVLADVSVERTESKRLAYSYIRYSSEQQMTKKDGAGGDSIRRQIENQNIAVEKYNLRIEETFSDYAKSAFRGKNRLSGALANFLNRLEAGQIPEGSYLLIESFDRLSRERMTSGLNTVLTILRKKIKIITTDDLKLYDLSIKGKDLEQTIMITVLLERANNESEVKSNRQKAKWEGRREKIIAGDKKFLSKNVPWWLALNEDNSYSFIPDRVAEIKRIIDLITNQNLGLRAAAAFINENNPVKTKFGKNQTEKGWTARGIKRLIETPSLYGCLQLCENIYTEDKATHKRVVIKEMDDFYPAVVSKTEWENIAAKISGRRTGKAKPTRRDMHFYNVFHGMIKCSLCGGTLRYSQKQSNAYPSKYNYLVCRNSEIKLCSFKKTLTVHYHVFNEAFFKFAKYYNFDALITDSENSDIYELLKHFEDDVELKKAKVRKFTSSLFEMFDGEIPEDQKLVLIEQNKEIKAAETKIKNLRAKASVYRPDSTTVSDAINQVESLLSTKEGRLKLNNHLNSIIDGIDFQFGLPTGSTWNAYQVRFKSGFKHQVIFNKTQSLSFDDDMKVFAEHCRSEVGAANKEFFFNSEVHDIDIEPFTEEQMNEALAFAERNNPTIPGVWEPISELEFPDIEEIG